MLFPKKHLYAQKYHQLIIIIIIIFKFEDTPAVRYWNRISGVEHARDYDAYARRKRNVFSLDLNVSNDKLFLISIGIVFHSFGAATEKARVARTV